MSRFEDIREEVQYMVDILYELHDATDPRKGAASEEGKLHRAQRAISVWWYIYARLMQWAQSHIIGYEMARLNPACREILEKLSGRALDPDSHELEHLGSMYAANPPNPGHPGPDGNWTTGDETLDALSDEVEKKNLNLDDEVLRRVIVRLLLSTSADSSVWRFPLQEALRALNSGEVLDFFKPSKQRRRGQSFQLDCAKADAIKYVYYLVGKLLTKHEALEKVGNAVGASVETLRGWEKELRKDDWFEFMWDAAKIAGRIEASPDDALDDLPVWAYDGRNTNIETAGYVIRELQGSCSLPNIRQRLHKHGKLRMK